MKAVTVGYRRAATEVDPHNYYPADIMVQNVRSKIGEGCYRTRASVQDGGGKMTNYDIVTYADSVWACYHRD